MEHPVFKLERVVKQADDMSDFEGPLILILQLISKNKVEIKDISISLILEQYLEFLDAFQELDLNIAGDFVEMASHLAYIKTKMLLNGDEEITELERLISSLERLRRGDVLLRIREVAETFSGMCTGEGMYPGPPEFLPPSDYAYVHIGDDLLRAVTKLFNRQNESIREPIPLERIYPKRVVYPIPDKIEELLEKLKAAGSMSLADVFSGNESKTELIATFIAVLELCRAGNVMLTGDEEGITISYSGLGRLPISLDLTAARQEVS